MLDEGDHDEQLIFAGGYGDMYSATGLMTDQVEVYDHVTGTFRYVSI